MILRIVRQRVLTSRPAEGWFALPLLLSLVGLVVAAVLEVGWVAEDGAVVPAAAAGFLFGVLLAKRPSPPLIWLLHFVYALLIPFLTLANLFAWPPLGGGWPAVRLFWLQRGALFVDRFASWWVAVLDGGRSQETVVFAYFLAVLAYLLPAFAVWSTLRQRRPLLGVSLLGIALAANSYFGAIGPGWAAVFIGLLVFLAAMVHFADLEQQWEETAVDYSDEIRTELAFYTAGMALLLVGFSFLLPAFNIRDIQEWLQRQTTVAELESDIDRAFGGVAQPRAVRSPGGVGGAGTLPRSYLLDAPPEQLQTVMMTATVAQLQNGVWAPPPTGGLRGAHWRALSYDVYTGRGWAISEERREIVPRGAAIPLPEDAPQRRLRQDVNWLRDERVIRYALGQPVRFDQDVTAAWRGLTDLARVSGEGTRYVVESALPAVPERELRRAAVADVPPQILARYTALPETIPPPVYELAAEVAAPHDNPYDQARALEQFLRQYPYSLEVTGPPPNVDPVAYFLFELQAGYCDYYASAMVVMARSLGLPARMGVGYLAQSPDEAGVQTIRQLHGHSWAEIYFAGVGWVEFEPTGSFDSPRDTRGTGTAVSEAGAESELPPSPPPIPESARIRPFPWLRVLLVGVPVLALLVVWRREQRRVAAARRADPVGFAYGRLQQEARRLRYPLSAAQTPHEFAAGFSAWLPVQRWPRLLRGRLARIRSRAVELTGLLVAHRFGGEEPAGLRAGEIWRQLRGLLRPLAVWQWLRIGRKTAEPD